MLKSIHVSFCVSTLINSVSHLFKVLMSFVITEHMRLHSSKTDTYNIAKKQYFLLMGAVLNVF